MVSLNSGDQQDSWSWSRNSRLSLSRPGIGLGLDRISKSRQVLVLVSNKISGLAELWRLLCWTLTSNLSWSNHVLDITRRATKNLWVLIRFKNLGATTEQLSTVYQTRIRSILEFASPVFHSSLTKDQSKHIESTQKKTLAIILGKDYNYYE